jgi:hypothetical protein
VFENRVLSRIFGPRRGDVTRAWREMYNEEFLNLKVLQNAISVIKSWR